MNVAFKLLEYGQISTANLPIGQFKYSSKDFAYRSLPTTIHPLLDILCAGLVNPRFSYRYCFLHKGKGFGHCRYHLDGLERPEEIHRLITQGGLPTLGKNGQILSANTIWEFTGEYYHKAQPTDVDTWRLLLRASQTDMKYRNHWV